MWILFHWILEAKIKDIVLFKMPNKMSTKFYINCNCFNLMFLPLYETCEVVSLIVFENIILYLFKLYKCSFSDILNTQSHHFI